VRSFLALVAILCLTASASAGRLHPLSGGTKTESDAKDKKKIHLIAESETVRLTLADSGRYNFKGPVTGISLKVENLSDEPLTVDPTQFSAIDAQGRGYSGLAPEEAAKRHLAAHAGGMYALSSVLAGPMGGGHLNDSVNRKIASEFVEMALPPGTIPPHSFKEGIVFFEAPKEKKGEVKISLGTLWKEAFVFQGEK
jgi:hypothetical protein